MIHPHPDQGAVGLIPFWNHHKGRNLWSRACIFGVMIHILVEAFFLTHPHFCQQGVGPSLVWNPHKGRHQWSRLWLLRSIIYIPENALFHRPWLIRWILYIPESPLPPLWINRRQEPSLTTSPLVPGILLQTGTSVAQGACTSNNNPCVSNSLVWVGAFFRCMYSPLNHVLFFKK